MRKQQDQISGIQIRRPEITPFHAGNSLIRANLRNSVVGQFQIYRGRLASEKGGLA
jgi:hypothetical protein